MTKRKYLKPTKPIRFYWRKIHGAIFPRQVLHAEMGSLFGAAHITRYYEGEKWHNSLDDKRFATAWAARKHVEKLLGLEDDDG